jgi:hypothetical protein
MERVRENRVLDENLGQGDDPGLGKGSYKILSFSFDRVKWNGLP